jgi:small subunit ribosomal protein S11
MAESESGNAKVAEEKEKGSQGSEVESASSAPAESGSDLKGSGGEASSSGTETETETGVKAPRAKKGVKITPTGVAHIRATFNNTTVTISDPQGGVISWCTAGRAGFKGSRKSTAFAATTVGQDAARQAAAKGMREVEVRVCGAGSGRESAIRALQSSGLSVSVIKDVTPMPHNGCRSRKRRRV